MTLDEALKWADVFGSWQPPDGNSVALFALATEVRRLAGLLDSAPVAIMDTRDLLQLCAPTEGDFQPLYALRGMRVRLVLDEPPNVALSGAPLGAGEANLT